MTARAPRPRSGASLACGSATYAQLFRLHRASCRRSESSEYQVGALLSRAAAFEAMMSPLPGRDDDFSSHFRASMTARNRADHDYVVGVPSFNHAKTSLSKRPSANK